MILNRKVDYALRAVEYLSAQPPKKPIQLEEISDAQDIPEKFLSKILQTLVKTGLVNSVRGFGGGYWIGKPLNKITILDIIEAVDGSISINHCTGSKNKCKRHKSCSMHQVMIKVQDSLVDIISNTTIADVARLDK